MSKNKSDNHNFHNLIKTLIPLIIILGLALMLWSSPLLAAEGDKEKENKNDEAVTITMGDQLETVNKAVQKNAEEKKNNGDKPKLSHGIMAITFDDGPGPYTEKLLDALKERNIHATFFVVGSRVGEYEDIIKREFDEGHEIGNHSYNHTNLTKVSAYDQDDEIQNTKDAINKALGQNFFGEQCVRPPGGNVNDSVAQNLNSPIYLWSIDTLDWKSRDADAVKANIINQANDGAIILLHDLYESSVDGAIAAIDELSDRYIFCSVEEMFERKGQTPENGVIYNNLECDGVNLGYNALKSYQASQNTDNVDGAGDGSESETEKKEKEFPWGAFTLCCCIFLIFLACLKHTLGSDKSGKSNKSNKAKTDNNAKQSRTKVNKDHKSHSGSHNNSADNRNNNGSSRRGGRGNRR